MGVGVYLASLPSLASLLWESVWQRGGKDLLSPSIQWMLGCCCFFLPHQWRQLVPLPFRSDHCIDLERKEGEKDAVFLSSHILFCIEAAALILGRT